MPVSDADVSLLLTKLTLSPRGYPGVGNLEVSKKPAVTVMVARKRKRKEVRFADALGLKLHEEKIFDTAVIPLTFIEEFEENNDFLLFKNAYRPPALPDKPSILSLVPVCVPTSDVSRDRVRADRIQLEKAWSVDASRVEGRVRVLNFTYHKAVSVRWSCNNWATHVDTEASYVEGDGTVDTFSFELKVCPLPVGSRVQFCLSLEADGAAHWDNNKGSNYAFQMFRV